MTQYVVSSSLKETTSKKPEKKLLKSNQRASGHNNQGLITCRHRGRGHQRLYRKIDFSRKKLDWTACVQAIEYDPNRNAHIALIFYKDGERRYILAPKGIHIGRNIIAGFSAPIETGNSLPLWKVPLGIIIHNVELKRGSGGQLARSAGTSVRLIAREDGYATLRLPSGELRSVPQNCWATMGEVGNVEAKNKRLRKAGHARWLGWRPIVRGSVMNPVDHPHGGGEGRCPIGRMYPLTPWGKVRLGKKTRRSKKYSDSLILRRKKLNYYF
jgi:large subunit ribosomal protein L2